MEVCFPKKMIRNNNSITHFVFVKRFHIEALFPKDHTTLSSWSKTTTWLQQFTRFSKIGIRLLTIHILKDKTWKLDNITFQQNYLYHEPGQKVSGTWQKGGRSPQQIFLQKLTDLSFPTTFFTIFKEIIFHFKNSFPKVSHSAFSWLG